MDSRKGLLLLGKEIRKTRLLSWPLQLLPRMKPEIHLASLASSKDESWTL